MSSVSEAWIEASLKRAAELYDRGNTEPAEAIYHEILEHNPANLHAIHSLGLMALENHRAEQAANWFRRAIAIDGKVRAFHNNLGHAFQTLGQLQNAVECYGNAIKLDPNYANAHYNRGAALQALGLPQAALESYDHVLALNPIDPEAHNSRGRVLQDLDRLDEAVASYDRAILHRSNFAEAYSNRGDALRRRKELTAALASYDRAIELNHDYAEAYSNRGLALYALGRFDESLKNFTRAVDLKPDYAEAYSNRGTALYALRRFEEAVQNYDHAILIKPDYAGAHANRGINLAELDRIQEAIESYERAVRLKPDIPYLAANLLHAKMTICDWRGHHARVAELRERVLHDERAAPPFLVLAFLDSLDLQRRIAECWAENKYPARRAASAAAFKKAKHSKIRIGYFSGDFHAHAVAFLTAELFEKHDRSKFEFYGFSTGPDSHDEIRRRIEVAFDKFINVRNWSDAEIVALARELEIDIAVDLKGFTDDARTGIFALSAAPIQINYLGYPGTLGAEYFDYIVADRMLIPDSHRHGYTEKIVYLPNSYQPNDRKRRIADKLFTRAEVGLPSEGIVFCCFNSNYKITPEVFDIWTRILRRVERSVLWLLESSEIAAANLRNEANGRGIDPSRLVFAPRVPLPDHLARYRLADLFLDTMPYNAHTTASDALWAGLPVVTRTGDVFAARVAASLLSAVGLPELITTTAEDYEALAVELAKDPAKLACLKRKLANNRLTTALFDTDLYAQHIEMAYTILYERHRSDLPPDHIFVPGG
jgi:predicted O-linked N-acetylglucosamine transferase (SPINDLY family)